ncbi:MAG TPA: hypothetical protein VFP65_14295 [Anaeromyxobacteraceae bacterium]|nr:hypothetical protein [Anaeromyxobacteraceae bacterium]
MAFEWLNRFHRETEKDPRYAERTLAAYRLGMKAKGSIVGVRIETAPGCCALAAGLDPGRVHDPATAPRLPLEGCPRGRRCTCVYRPVMSYAGTEER